MLVLQKHDEKGGLSLGRNSIEPTCDESSEMNGSQEIPGELVVSGGDATEVLEPAEAAFDDLLAFVGALVERMDDDTDGVVWDYGLGAATDDFTAKAVTVIPFVGEERAHGGRGRIGRRHDIGILAWGQMQDDRPAERIAQRMEFCRAASSRAADCLVVLFSAGRTPASFDRGRVERQCNSIFAGAGQRFKDCAPSPSAWPSG